VPVTRHLEQPTRGFGGPPHLPLYGLAPGGVCLGRRLPDASCALTARLHPYSTEPIGSAEWYVSVALSSGSPPLGVTQRPALWSPDFPLRPDMGRSGRLTCSHPILTHLPGLIQRDARSRGCGRGLLGEPGGLVRATA